MRLDEEAPHKVSVSSCGSRWRQPSLFEDDTHAVVIRPRAQEHGLLTEKTWPIDMCDAGKCECET